MAQTTKATYPGRHVCFINEDGDVAELLLAAYKHEVERKTLGYPDRERQLQGILYGMPRQTEDWSEPNDGVVTLTLVYEE